MFKKLSVIYVFYGIKIIYDLVIMFDIIVIVKGVKFKVEMVDKLLDLLFGDVIFSDVEEVDDGGYYVGNVSFQNVDMSKDGGYLMVKDLQIDGFSILGMFFILSFDGMILFQSVYIGNIIFEQDGKCVFQIEKIESNVEVVDDSLLLIFDMLIFGIWVDLFDVKDLKVQEMINKLGLINFNGNIVMKGVWVLVMGKIDLIEFLIDVCDFGKFNLMFSMLGYMLQFIKVMQDVIVVVVVNLDKKVGEVVFGMMMMGLFQQFSFNSVVICFDDVLIIKCLFDYFGKEQGVMGEQFVQLFKGMVLIMMVQLNVLELQNQVLVVVIKFFDDLKNIEIKVVFVVLVVVLMIMGVVMGVLQMLLQVFGVLVNVNQ